SEEHTSELQSLTNLVCRLLLEKKKEASFPEFHSVYMDPESFAEYEKTGKYREGTVLIKDPSSVGAMKAPSGRSCCQGKCTRLLLPWHVPALGDLHQLLPLLPALGRQLGILQLLPQASAQGRGIQERCPRVQQEPSALRSVFFFNVYPAPPLPPFSPPERFPN